MVRYDAESVHRVIRKVVNVQATVERFGRGLQLAGGACQAWASAGAASSARSILAIVATSGVVLPFSIRFSVSGRMPARRANSAWESPAMRRVLMILRASDARAYSTAGYASCPLTRARSRLSGGLKGDSLGT